MERKRFFGIDLLRIVALLLFLGAQYVWLLPHAGQIMYSVASVMNHIGPEAFFVLSGFLMGGKINALYASDSFNGAAFRAFLKGRIMRIVPVYWLFLLLNLILAVSLGSSVPQLWKYVLLVQNFAAPIPDFFAESWGIPIILWANLLFPAVLFASGQLIKPRNKSRFFITVTLALLVFFIAIKCRYALRVAHSDMSQWDAALKSVVIYRLDAVFTGVLAGWLLARYHGFFDGLRFWFAAAGVAGLIFLLVGVGYLGLFIEKHPFFWNVCYLPLTSFIIAAFLPLMQFGDRKWAAKYGDVSQLVYIVYLLHSVMLLKLVRGYFSLHPVTTATMLLLLSGYLLTAVFLARLMASTLRFYAAALKSP